MIRIIISKFKDTPRLLFNIMTSTTSDPSNMRMPLEEQELTTLPEHMSSPPVFSGFMLYFCTRSLVLCVCFVDRCLSFFFWPLCCLFFVDLWILITSLWYLQTLLVSQYFSVVTVAIRKHQALNIITLIESIKLKLDAWLSFVYFIIFRCRFTNI